jgi:hypothetical protein
MPAQEQAQQQGQGQAKPRLRLCLQYQYAHLHIATTPETTKMTGKKTPASRHITTTQPALSLSLFSCAWSVSIVFSFHLASHATCCLLTLLALLAALLALLAALFAALLAALLDALLAAMHSGQQTQQPGTHSNPRN